MQRCCACAWLRIGGRPGRRPITWATVRGPVRDRPLTLERHPAIGSRSPSHALEETPQGRRFGRPSGRFRPLGLGQGLMLIRVSQVLRAAVVVHVGPGAAVAPSVPAPPLIAVVAVAAVDRVGPRQPPASRSFPPSPLIVSFPHRQRSGRHRHHRSRVLLPTSPSIRQRALADNACRRPRAAAVDACRRRRPQITSLPPLPWITSAPARTDDHIVTRGAVDVPEPVTVGDAHGSATRLLELRRDVQAFRRRSLMFDPIGRRPGSRWMPPRLRFRPSPGSRPEKPQPGFRPEESVRPWPRIRTCRPPGRRS